MAVTTGEVIALIRALNGEGSAAQAAEYAEAAEEAQAAAEAAQEAAEAAAGSMPGLASEDGDYILRQTDDQMSLVGKADLEPILYPTGDTTDRTAEILAKLTAFGECRMAKGDYTLSTQLVMPDNSKLVGTGADSRLIWATGSTGAMIAVGKDCQISSIKFDGGLAEMPAAATLKRDCILVDNNSYTLRISDAVIVGFAGRGLYIVDTGYGPLSSVQAVNCYFRYNEYGIRFGSHGEYGDISNCSFIDNYFGVNVAGGNNIFHGCMFERNNTGARVDGSGADNSGHGAFIGCSMNHNLYQGLAIANTDNGYLVSGCQIMRNEGKDLVVNCPGVLITGCHFGVSAKLQFSSSAFAMLIGNVFATNPTMSFSGTADTYSRENYRKDGKKVNVLRTGYNDSTSDFPALLTIVDDGGNASFYSDILPLIQTYKVPISAAVPVSAVGTTDYMTWAQIEECWQKGAEILSNTYANDSSIAAGVTEQDIDDDYRKAKHTLLGKGYGSGTHLVYSGTTGESDLAISAASHVYDVALQAGGDDTNHLRKTNKYSIKRFDIPTTYEYDETAIKGLIDDCLESGGWMVWKINTGSNAWDSSAKDAIEAAIAYAIEHELPIVTVDHVVQTYLNKL